MRIRDLSCQEQLLCHLNMIHFPDSKLCPRKKVLASLTTYSGQNNLVSSRWTRTAGGRPPRPRELKISSQWLPIFFDQNDVDDTQLRSY